MKAISWNSLKSQRLKKTRGISFEEIIEAKLIDIRKHPTREDQRILVYEYKRYLWAVPCAVDGEKLFLKMIYRSRKLMKIYKKR